MAMDDRQAAPRYDQTPVRSARECSDTALDLIGVADADWMQFHAQLRGHGLDRTELPAPGRDSNIPQHRCPRHARRDLLEKLQPFSAYAVFIHEEAGDVAPGPRQALDKSPADRIDDRPEYDRHFGTRSLDCHHGRAAIHHHDVRGEREG